MPRSADYPRPAEAALQAYAPWVRRFGPLVLVLAITGVVLALGLHNELSLEALVRRRTAFEAFVVQHPIRAVATYFAIYAVTVALSIPVAAILTISGGALFGTLIGGCTAVCAATVGASIIFLAARTAVGEWLVQHAGARAERLAVGFRSEAFTYLLFLRLVPLFPFWLVNLVPALCGVGLLPFLGATALGIIPVTFALAFFGSSLDRLVDRQEQAYRACVLAGGEDCRLNFDFSTVATPHLMAALFVVGLVVLVPVLVRRVRASRAGSADERSGVD
jgi:uncharacterized membrane protein YdjX (TVP38/TMEM64 family)